MSTKKRPSEAQREKWREAAKEKERAAFELVSATAEGFKEDPAALAEYFSFASRFRQYSPRNTMLILAQNPGAAFCLPFVEWKRAGFSVNKGEHGLLLYVFAPYKTIRFPDGTRIPYKDATADARARADAGELETVSVKSFKVGTTFDVSQTDFPDDELPRLVGRGRPSAEHGAAYEALKEYCARELGVKVVDDAGAGISSVVLRGSYSPSEKAIRINPALADTVRLSTLAHEMGHAILQHDPASAAKPTAQREFEADAVSIMTVARLGLPVEEVRASHLQKCYGELLETWAPKEDPKAAIPPKVLESFGEAFCAFDAASQGMDKAFAERGLSVAPDPRAALQGLAPAPPPEREKARTVASAASSAKARAAEINARAKQEAPQRAKAPRVS